MGIYGLYGPSILARTLSQSTRTDRFGNAWQYHSRSDHHSKVAFWSILFDLISSTPLLRKHIESGQVFFGIIHEMRDFALDRKKDLDLVICTPNGPPEGQDFADLAKHYQILLEGPEAEALSVLPTLRRAPVGSVLIALEAKACMTAHQRALPRLYDELNSSHLAVHGASEHAIAAGFVMVNIADEYLSPDLNKKNRAKDPEWSFHKQPRDASLAIEKAAQLPRRSKVGEHGYDALGLLVVDLKNDGSQVSIHARPPAPQRGEIFHYDSMITRLASHYATRFKDIG